MKRGMTKADKKATQKNNGGLASTLFRRRLTRKKLRQHRRTANALQTRETTAAVKINSRRMRGDLQ